MRFGNLVCVRLSDRFLLFTASITCNWNPPLTASITFETLVTKCRTRKAHAIVYEIRCRSYLSLRHAVVSSRHQGIAITQSSFLSLVESLKLKGLIPEFVNSYYLKTQHISYLRRIAPVVTNLSRPFVIPATADTSTLALQPIPKPVVHHVPSKS